MSIKTYRDLLSDGEQLTIPLHSTGKGFKIKHFEIMSNLPTSGGHKEHVVQVWKVKQTSVPTTAPAPIDFSNQALLAAAWTLTSDSPAYASSQSVMFDREIINQNIYVTHTDTDGTDTCNFYLELEEITMNDAESAVVNFNAAIVHDS
jgi:hypothetical protein